MPWSPWQPAVQVEYLPVQRCRSYVVVVQMFSQVASVQQMWFLLTMVRNANMTNITSEMASAFVGVSVQVSVSFDEVFDADPGRVGHSIDVHVEPGPEVVGSYTHTVFEHLVDGSEVQPLTQDPADIALFATLTTDQYAPIPGRGGDVVEYEGPATFTGWHLSLMSNWTTFVSVSGVVIPTGEGMSVSGAIVSAADVSELTDVPPLLPGSYVGTPVVVAIVDTANPMLSDRDVNLPSYFDVPTVGNVLHSIEADLTLPAGTGSIFRVFWQRTPPPGVVSAIFGDETRERSASGDTYVYANFVIPGTGYGGSFFGTSGLFAPNSLIRRALFDGVSGRPGPGAKTGYTMKFQRPRFRYWIPDPVLYVRRDGYGWVPVADNPDFAIRKGGHWFAADGDLYPLYERVDGAWVHVADMGSSPGGDTVG